MKSVEERLGLIEARLDLVEEALTLLPEKLRLMRNEGFNEEDAEIALEVRGLKKQLLEKKRGSKRD